MTAPGMRDFELTFTRIGRTGNGAPLSLAVTVDDGPAAAVADQIAEHAYDHARPYVRSSELDVIVRGTDAAAVDAQLDGANGVLTVGGFRNAGEFTVREVTVR